MHIVITDSGLGGLSICGQIERNLGRTAPPCGTHLTYVNAWPDEGTGYNDLPDIAARAAMFDRALASIAAMAPDRIVIACNTLSILYPGTSFSHETAVPVMGIVEAGVTLFREALTADQDAHLVLIGTKTTIESGEHRARLISGGIAPERVVGQSCHGLAAAIETDPDGRRARDLIESCTASASSRLPADRPSLLGLCCTHYTYVAERLRTAMSRHAGREVGVLDPNRRLADLVAPASSPAAPAGIGAAPVAVSIISKVALSDRARQSIARLIEGTSPATSQALLSYVREPDLF